MRSIGLCVLALTGCVKIGQSVVTQHNDSGRSGANLDETELTPARVNAGMRLRVWRPLAGLVSAQALYVSGVSMRRARHNVIYVQSQPNAVEAYDADDTTASGTTHGRLWHTTLPVTPDPSVPNPLYGANGIQGTPVIDRAANIMYLVYGLDNGAFPAGGQGDAGYVVKFHLAALDIRSGRVLRDSVIHAQVPSAVAPGYAEFAPQRQVQRAGLLLTPDLGSRGPKSVYVAFASRWHEETINWHGWVMRYDAATFQMLSAFCSTPDRRDVSNGGGIWEGGGGLVADDSGSVYFLTGNGPSDSVSAHGNSIVKLTPVAWSSPGTYGFTVSAFSAALDDPAHAAQWENNDIDLGAGGSVLVPETSTLIGGGKTGFYYVMQTLPSLTKAQEFAAFTNRYDPAGRYDNWQSGPHLHGAPTFWWVSSDSGYVYAWAEKDSLRRYTYHRSTGLLDTLHALAAPILADSNLMPGGNTSLSANGQTDGILWVTHPLPGSGEVLAFDALTLQPIWHDTLPVPAHFAPPTIADGRVIVATGDGKLLIYELGRLHAPKVPPPAGPLPWWLIPQGDPAWRVQAALAGVPVEQVSALKTSGTIRVVVSFAGTTSVVANSSLNWTFGGIDGVVIDDIGLHPSMGYGGRGDTLATLTTTADHLTVHARDGSSISARLLAGATINGGVIPWQSFETEPRDTQAHPGSRLFDGITHIQLLGVNASQLPKALHPGEAHRVTVRGLIVLYTP